MLFAIQVPTLPWLSANGISSTNEECPIPQTRQFQPLTFKTALSGSGTNKVRRGTRPVERRSPISRVIRHLGVSHASLLDPVVRRSQRSFSNSGHSSPHQFIFSCIACDGYGYFFPRLCWTDTPVCVRQDSASEQVPLNGRACQDVSVVMCD